jgi:hypothetical protein
MTILSSMSGSVAVAKSGGGGSSSASTNIISTLNPYLYYSNEGLSSYSENSDITTWSNTGSAGSGYNLTQASTWSTRPFIQTVSGYKSARFDSSSRGLQFTNGSPITVQSSDNRDWTMISVMRADDQNLYFFSNYQSNSNVGGIGWYGSTIHWMYENDGAQVGANPSNSGGATQYLIVARSNNTATCWINKNNSPYYDSTAASSYGVVLSIRGLGASRSRYGLGNIFETAYWQRALNSSEITQVRNYLGAKFSNLGSTNS